MRVWLVAVLAGLIGFGLARWMGEVRTDSPADPEVASVGAEGAGTDPDAAPLAPAAASKSEATREASARPSADPATPQAGMPPEAPAADGPKLALDAVAFLREWPARLDDLATRARGGEVRALTDLAEALDYCTSASAAIQIARFGVRRLGNLADATVQAYFSQVDEQCKAFLLRHSWLSELSRESRERFQAHMQAFRERRISGDAPRPPASAAEALRRRAADAGDVVAEGLTNDDDVRRACGATSPPQTRTDQQAVWQCVHAAARERLAGIFARRDPREIEAIPGILMAMNAQLLNGSEYVRGNSNAFEENNVRWILTACEFGLDCGPASRAMRWACANYGACGYRHYRDYAADRLLPPATMRMVDGQVPRLVNLILAGDVDTILGPPPSYGIPGRP